MRRRFPLIISLSCLCLSATALAVKIGQSLFIRNKDTKVLASPDVKGKVLTLLQPGTAVTWGGPNAANRQLHQVSFRNAKGADVSGFVLQANLTPQKPSPEFLVRDDGAPIDPQAFKSSGAATKALDDAAFTYAEQKHFADAPQRLVALERISRSVDPRALAERQRSLGLAAPEAVAAAPTKKGGAK